MVSVATKQPEYAIGRDDDPAFQCPSRDRAIGLVENAVGLLGDIGSTRSLYAAVLQLQTLTEQLVRDYPVHTQSTIHICRALFSKIIVVLQQNSSIRVQDGQADIEELLSIFQQRQSRFESDAITPLDPQSSPDDL